MENFANTIIFWGAVVAAGTGILVAIIKLLKFLKTVSDKMEFLNKIEVHEESR